MKNILLPEWVKDAIFYQIFPERFNNGNSENDPPNTVPWGNKPTRDSFFGGDLVGIIKKFEYIKDLGVNAIYLNPIFQAGTNHKYDTWDYFKIDPNFGSINDFKKLINNAHKLNIRIILDGVFNHCGDGFWAFKDVCSFGKKSKYYNWFIINDDNIQNNPINYQTAGACNYLPKLNVSNSNVKKYIHKIIEFWTKLGIDGWRFDVPWKVSSKFWKSVRNIVKDINPDSYLVGEEWHDAQPWIKRDMFDGVMNYRLRDHIINFFIKDKEDAEDFNYRILYLKKLYGEYFFTMLNLLSSHDTPRIFTIARNNKKRLLLAISFLMTFIGSPMIYYGDEIGMKGGNDPDCRRVMLWDEDLWDWEIHNTYKRLIDLRKSHESLRYGDFKTLLTFNKVYAYLRTRNKDYVIVVLNSGEKQPNIKISMPKFIRHHNEWKDVLSNRVFKILRNELILEDISNLRSYILIPK